MPTRIAARLVLTVSLLAFAHPVRSQAVAAPTRASDEWASYGRDPGGARHSPLAQMTRENVGRLREAWRFSTGETDSSFATGKRTSFEATPLVVGGTMYVSTPIGRTVDARLIALDAGDGGTGAGFGDGGTIDLRRGLRQPPSEFEEYELTSPPAVVNGMIVVGSAIADNTATVMASGEVRGYHARTGALRWRFDPVPRDSADPAWGGWRGPTAHRTGGANAWSVMVGDPARGLVFVPTSSPSPDYYGGERLGDNRHASSVVALDARTGRVVWSFQTVHHDLWDYDNASPPALVTLRLGGRSVDALLQATKSGMLFVLDRATGKPLLPVEERRVPASTVPGEVASPTQPFSIILSPHRLDAASAFGADSADAPPAARRSPRCATRGSSPRRASRGRSRCRRTSAARTGAASHSIPRASSPSSR
ncbi:MAG: Pyrrolo-quinoline quinone beta-propeller repeat-containing protein [Gemmatimonadetes bacterium]|nr:Pyrrolo-quinoline quinone beta-propeller repeat-containing protein [Gemmatimonadota bacterium]